MIRECSVKWNLNDLIIKLRYKSNLIKADILQVVAFQREANLLVEIFDTTDSILLLLKTMPIALLLLG
jgi:hypothetical protein